MKEKTDEELLKLVLRDQFDRVANQAFRDLVQSGRRELPLTDIAYDRLMAGIELGRRVSEPTASYNPAITSTNEAVKFCESHFHRLITDGVRRSSTS